MYFWPTLGVRECILGYDYDTQLATTADSVLCTKVVCIPGMSLMRLDPPPRSFASRGDLRYFIFTPLYIITLFVTYEDKWGAIEDTRYVVVLFAPGVTRRLPPIQFPDVGKGLLPLACKPRRLSAEKKLVFLYCPQS